MTIYQGGIRFSLHPDDVPNAQYLARRVFEQSHPEATMLGEWTLERLAERPANMAEAPPDAVFFQATGRYEADRPLAANSTRKVDLECRCRRCRRKARREGRRLRLLG